MSLRGHVPNLALGTPKWVPETLGTWWWILRPESAKAFPAYKYELSTVCSMNCLQCALSSSHRVASQTSSKAECKANLWLLTDSWSICSDEPGTCWESSVEMTPAPLDVDERGAAPSSRWDFFLALSGGYGGPTPSPGTSPGPKLEEARSEELTFPPGAMPSISDSNFPSDSNSSSESITPWISASSSSPSPWAVTSPSFSISLLECSVGPSASSFLWSLLSSTADTCRHVAGEKAGKKSTKAFVRFYS